METKICSKCNEEKELSEFTFRTKTNKPISSCKKCENDRVKLYNDQNFTKVLESKKRYRENNKNKISLGHKKWRENNKNVILLKSKKWYSENKEKRIEYEKEYRVNNRIKINKYFYDKRRTDLLYKLTCNYRLRIYNFLKITNLSKNNDTISIIGCTPNQLKEHLENQFTEGMSWENYGLFGWHIDHIIPLSSAKTEEELYKLCNYSNLQPLWAEDNLKKGNKILI
jgi:hypothetical protein